MADEVDVLKIKIDKAKGELPPETRKAIEAVDWKSVIFGMRESKGYSFEQLGDLETETELLLCGLVSPKDYPGELEQRMRIPKARADELVNEMNQLVFSRIREEMIKNAETKSVSEVKAAPIIKTQLKSAPAPSINKAEMDVLNKAGIKMVGQNLDTPELKAPVSSSSILSQKFKDSFKIPTAKTEYTAVETTPKAIPPTSKTYPKGADPYRLPPE